MLPSNQATSTPGSGTASRPFGKSTYRFSSASQPKRRPSEPGTSCGHDLCYQPWHRNPFRNRLLYSRFGVGCKVSAASRRRGGSVPRRERHWVVDATQCLRLVDGKWRRAMLDVDILSGRGDCSCKVLSPRSFCFLPGALRRSACRYLHALAP